MSTRISPGVTSLERDLSNIVSPPSTNIAFYVGRATKGPVWKKTLVDSERYFADLFGEPTETTYEDFFTVSGFFNYANSLYFTRVVDKATAKNSQLLASTTLSPSAGDGDYVEKHAEYTPTFGTEKVQFFAKYPGEYGDTDFKVVVISKTDFDSISTSPTLSAYESFIDEEPETTNEFIVLVSVLGADGEYELEEKFLVSDTIGDKDNNGNNLYINEKINRSSQYLLAFNNVGATAEPISFAETLLGGGADGDMNEGDIILGYEIYDDPEEIEVNFAIGGKNTAVATANAIIALAEARKDVYGILDVPKSDVVNVANISTAVQNVIDYRKSELNANTSYAGLYANWLLVYDKYNDVDRWVPSSGHVAGIFAKTAETNDTWWASAGLNRGILRNVNDLAISPKETYRDKLYKGQVNAIANFLGEGRVVWGQKTLQTKPSAFDRANVRLLFIYMEKAIARSAKYIVFEPNDSLTRTIFTNQVEPFLEDIKGRRGVYDFLVDVGDKVNTPERIDRNEFWAEIFVKPVKSAEFIFIRYTATKTGVDFSELG